MTRSQSFVASFALITGLTLAACSGGGGGSTNTQPCGAPSGQVVLAYPAPGATGIPDNFAGIVFASTNGLTSGYQAFIVPAGSSTGQYLATVTGAHHRCLRRTPRRASRIHNIRRARATA